MFEAFFYFLNFNCMKQLLFLGVVCLPFYIISQESQGSSTSDARYLEDQFYAGLTYNFILDRPNDASQRNFSYGLQAGFIKDIPINVDRTVALGIGIGLGLNTYYSNIEASETPNGIEYAIITADFRRSKLETHLVEVPFEIRFRNSRPDEYKFWRLYTGIKLGYIYNARSKLVLDSGKNSFKNTDLEKFQYGITLNLGYNTFNIHAYYSLTNLFSDGTTVNGEDINITPLRIGLIFYIL